MEGAVLSGTDALLLFKQSGKIQGVFITDRQGDDGDRQVGLQQQIARFPDAQVQKIFLKGRSGGGFEDPVQVGAVQLQIIGDGSDGDALSIAGFQTAERFLDIDGLLFLDTDLLLWEFAHQKEQIFIQDTVHDQIPVCRKLVGLEHFLVTEPDPVILAVVEDRCRQKRGPLQIFMNLDALKTDPGIGPGILFVGFVVDEFVRADEEGVAFAQAPGMSAGPVIAAAA